jgi:hypothetical protein
MHGPRNVELGLVTSESLSFAHLVYLFRIIH